MSKRSKSTGRSDWWCTTLTNPPDHPMITESEDGTPDGIALTELVNTVTDLEKRIKVSLPSDTNWSAAIETLGDNVESLKTTIGNIVGMYQEQGDKLDALEKQLKEQKELFDALNARANAVVGHNNEIRERMDLIDESYSNAKKVDPNPEGGFTKREEVSEPSVAHFNAGAQAPVQLTEKVALRLIDLAEGKKQ